MITTVLILAGASISVVAVIVFALNLVHAPEADENETGFHYAKIPSTVRSHYYCSRSEAVRSTKPAKSQPLKEYIPAA